MSQYLQELFSKKEEVLQAELAKTEETIKAGFTRMDESLHTENVKVYRNVQAVVVDEVGNKAESVIKAQEENVKKTGKPILIFSVLGFATAVVSLVIQILELLNFKIF